MIFLTRVQNGLLALAASFVYLFRRKKAGDPQRILVIQGAKMGDMVCTTPLFRAIKERYPRCALYVMGNALNKELLAGNPHINEYLVRPPGLSALIESISKIQPDAAILPGPDNESLQALLFARVSQVIVPRIENGWSPYETLSYRFLARSVDTAPHHMGSYAPREYLRLLEPLGIFSEDTRKELYVSEEATTHAKYMLEVPGVSGEKLIGIAPGVGNKAKVWGGARFAEVAQALGERPGRRIVLIGGAGDAEEVRAMRSALPSSLPLIDLSNKLSLEELKAVIGELSLFISVDTGPIYIAEAFGIPTVDIVGPMDENEQPPQGVKHRVVVPQRERPMLHIMNAAVFNLEEARRQAEAVTPKEVIREAEALL
ncbi:glycosyltransferase family 9 protein [Candidatus Parcubacteria bacterium]|nr:glycosyltransferase family 9 protein [Candidatus Parcubacteria bacterium]